MPAWITAYPGASEQTRRMGPAVESAYTADAPPRDVLSHFRRLFAAAGLKFDPGAAGNGFLIRATPPECDLFIRIHRVDSGTAVEVTCSTGPAQGQTQRSLEQADQSHRSHIDAMEKFDTPVYPAPRRPVPPMPLLAWPAWLVRVDNVLPEAQRGTDQFRLHYLKTTYASSAPASDIQAFYADLLSANGYRVYFRSPASTPKDRKIWLEADQQVEGRAGRRFVIRIDLTPANGLVTVDLRMTAHP